jgi:hypothetical protein
MSPDRAQDRTLQLSQGLFGAPPGWRGPARPTRLHGSRIKPLPREAEGSGMTLFGDKI